MRLPKVSDSRALLLYDINLCRRDRSGSRMSSARGRTAAPRRTMCAPDNGALSRCTGFGAAKNTMRRRARCWRCLRCRCRATFLYTGKKENDTLLLRAADGEYREKYDADNDGLIFEKTSVLDCSGTTYAVNYQSDSGAELICRGADAGHDAQHSA